MSEGLNSNPALSAVSVVGYVVGETGERRKVVNAWPRGLVERLRWLPEWGSPEWGPWASEETGLAWREHAYGWYPEDSFHSRDMWWRRSPHTELLNGAPWGAEQTEPC